MDFLLLEPLYTAVDGAVVGSHRLRHGEYRMKGSRTPSWKKRRLGEAKVLALGPREPSKRSGLALTSRAIEMWLMSQIRREVGRCVAGRNPGRQRAVIILWTLSILQSICSDRKIMPPFQSWKMVSEV
jgi:hypothetical protein